MKRGRADVGVRMMHEGGDSDYTGGSICLTDTLPGLAGNKKQTKQIQLSLFSPRKYCKVQYLKVLKVQKKKP